MRTGLGRISALGHDVAEHVLAWAPVYDVKFHFGALPDVVESARDVPCVFGEFVVQ